MTLPNKTHQANSRARRAAQGLVRVEVWVPEEYRSYMKYCAGVAQRRGVMNPQDVIKLTKDQSDE